MTVHVQLPIDIEVPLQDAADNVDMVDVIGNKTDTVAGDSIVSLAKQIIALWPVSAQDAAANVDVSDVIGNKTDTIAGTSIVALIRQLLALWPVSAQDAAANVDIADVVGNKTDTVAGTSIVALIRQLLALWPVTAQDSAANVDIADVIGNKLDATHTGGNSIYALLHTIEEHFHARQRVYPPAANPVVLTAINGVGSWSNGAWVQVVPLTTITNTFDVHHLDISAISANEDFEIDIANGTTVIATISFTRGGVQSQSVSRPVETDIQAANSQIQARLRSGADNGETCGIKIWYHEYI
jgi:hypothetical protein